MTIKGWGRVMFGLGAICAVVVVPITTAILLLDEGQVSTRELRTVVNGRNNAVPFNYSYGDSYGSNARNEENAYQNSYLSSLIRTTGENEQIKGIVGFDEESNEHIFGDPTDVVFTQSLKLELAEAILIYDQDNKITHAIFNDDEFDRLSQLPKYEGVPNHLKLNEPESTDGAGDATSDIINGGGTNTAVEFVVREDLNWVDNNGNATEYEIVAEDFYYSIYHTGLSNNAWRNDEYDSEDNPFGGHGSLGDEFPEDGDDYPATWQLGVDLDSAYSIAKFSNRTGGFSNTFLFNQFGLMPPSEMVKSSTSETTTGIASNPNMLGQFQNQNTVRINVGSNPDTTSQLYEGIITFLADGQTLAPVPSMMIDEVESQKTSVRGVEILGGIAKDLGFYTYGVSHDTLLYASPYYVSSSDQFRLVLEQNEHYWDQEWVDNQDTVSKYTIDFIESIDENIHSQSEFSQFQTDKVYKIDYSNLDSRSQREVLTNPDDFGIRYVTPYNEISLETNMLPIMMQEPMQNDADDYLMNNAMAELWYGTPLVDIHHGNARIHDYLTVEARAFRSQIVASINWFSFSRVINPDGSHEDWLSYMPPDIPLATTDNSGETVYDNKEDFTTVNYIDSNGTSYSITSEENYNHYVENSGSSFDQMKSTNYEAISRDITWLIDDIFVAEDEKVTFPIKISQQNPSLQELDLYSKYEETIEGLDPRIDVELHSYNNDWPGDLTKTNGTERYVGAEATYSGVSSLFSALGSYGTSIQVMASDIKKHSSLGQEFPELLKYATEWENYVDGLRIKHGIEDESHDWYIDDANTLSELTNEIIGAAAGPDLPTLLHSYSHWPPVDSREEYDAHYYDLETAVVTFDSLYFRDTLTDREAIDLILEVREIMGVTFGDVRSISRKDTSHPVIYRNDLSIPILNNGQSYLQDWRVNQTRASSFA